MAVEKAFRCDLCGEMARKESLATVRVGNRELRPEDYTILDIGPECAERPIRELLVTAAEHAREEGAFR